MGFWNTGFVILMIFNFGWGQVLGPDRWRDEQFKAVEESFWSWMLEEYPELATHVGVHSYDDKVTEVTEEAFLRRKVNATTFLEDTTEFENRNLNDADKIRVKLLKFTLQTFIDGYPFRKFGIYSPFNIFSNPVSMWKLMVVYNAKLKTSQDYHNLLSRYHALPKQFDDFESLMEMAIEEGITHHRKTITSVLDDLTAEISNEGNTFLKPFNATKLDTISDGSAILSEASRTVSNEILPALDKMRRFIQFTYMRQLRDDIGLSSLPGGKQAYEQYLKFHLSTDMSPEEVHQLGLDEVARIEAHMEKIMREDEFEGSMREYANHLLKNPQHHYSSEEDILEDIQRIANQTRSKLSLIFRDLPEKPYAIKGDPSQYATRGRYEDPRDGIPGTFIVGISNLEKTARYMMPSLTLHELEPGHHTQISAATVLSKRSYGPLPFISYCIPYEWSYYSAYSEGWALYAESLGQEMGIYTDKYSKYGMYASEVYRATRLVVDTGIHAFGWSFDKAFEYMQNHTTLSDIESMKEIRRYISLPGQACSYKIGQLKMFELRGMAEKAMGDEFNLKDFHYEVLRVGRVPLQVLQEHIQDWIKSRTGGQGLNSSTRISITCIFSHLVIFVITICFQTHLWK